MRIKKLSALFILFSAISCHPAQAAAPDGEKARLEKRMEAYQYMGAATHIPWYYLAAVDQYERNIRQAQRHSPKPEGIIAIHIPKEKWAGWFNPDPDDKNPLSILVFQGFGRDGNGDGKADPSDGADVLYSFADYLLQYGPDDENIRIALWNYYQRDKTVGIILNIAKLFKTYGRIDLQQKHFPLPVYARYSYRDTWGDRRGWGGRRIHEGTDIFAHYGTEVYSTCYGVVEMKGWNKYGGWRVGIRDINNTYHYYAHLNHFSKNIKIGDVVEPGQLIGTVGSSGYGPKGTAGKFPPHLHYGMYKDNGRTEWSFDPYPYLKRWERETKANKGKKG